MTTDSARKPVLALTLGDVAGVGPELIAKACANEEVQSICRPVIFGDAGVVARAQKMVGAEFKIQPVSQVEDEVTGGVACLNPASVDLSAVAHGTVNSNAGRAAYEFLRAAIHAALAGRVAGIVTAPINKAALNLAGVPYPGHTEVLASECNVDRHAMMLYLASTNKTSQSGLAIAHVTLHTSIASVPGFLSGKKIGETIELVDGFLKRVGLMNPRIGVCALNPHAGEDGLFGDEELRLIAPAIRAAGEGGIRCDGPLPADTLFRRAFAGEFDGVVAMYHDQGHIAMKLVGFDEAVNITLGLPIIRTSPSQGTAFDIAGMGMVRETGFVEAIRMAVRLANSPIDPT